MKRRDFIAAGVGAGAWGGAAVIQPAEATAAEPEIIIERALSGKPHTGKVLAAIQPHADDIPLFAGGTVAKLVNEGYTGYLIRTTNDDKAGAGTAAEAALSNERDNEAVAKALGLKGVFNLDYRNHRMDAVSPQEIRGRIIHLIRLLKIDTVISYDPWGHYEENPDHYVTARAVESACWMAGMSKDYPEQLQRGVEPHSVRERYYYARGPQLVNRIVDISGTIRQKIDANLCNRTQGPCGENGARLRDRLAKEGRRLPILGDNDETANRRYIEHLVLDYASQSLRGIPSDREFGRRYGLEWAEAFHYVGPGSGATVEDYIRQHAVKL